MRKHTSKQLTNLTYYYTYWDEENKAYITIPITLGQDGVKEDHILLLQSLDHREALDNRYAEEHLGFDTENKKANCFEDSESFPDDPIENLGTSKTDPAYLLDPDSDEPSTMVELLSQLMQELEPQQVDLIYEVFGACRQLTEIAKEQGVTTAAVSRRISKIIARLKKLFAQKGIS